MKKLNLYKETKINLTRRVLWIIVSRLVFKLLHGSKLNFLRVLILKLFGAKLGKVNIYPSVDIYAPWNLTIGDFTTIGPHVEIYNKTDVTIGTCCVVSQHTMIYTASHDFRSAMFDLVLKPVSIGDRTWLCAGVFIAPGVSLGCDCVVSAKSVVFDSFSHKCIIRGNPANFIGSAENNVS